MPEVAVVVEALTLSRGPRTILHPLSFQADYGAVTAIVGPNGAGKSSLLRGLLGLLPIGGRVSIAGRELRGLTPRQRAQLIAYVPQHSLLTSNVSVREVVAQGRFAHLQGFGPPGAQSAPIIARALADAQVEPLAERAYNKLSGGEQRRVLLARALATEARVLLLDEPTAGLDVAQVLRFFQLVRALTRRGLCVISVLHDLLDVHQHADRALLLRDGRLEREGPAREVVTSPETERAYGVRMNPAIDAPFRLLEQNLLEQTVSESQESTR